MSKRYPKLSEKIHSERNWLRCKDDWTAHAVELERRVDELEDTIRMRRAEGNLHSSFGRDEHANRVLADISARRGQEWPGVWVDDAATEEPR